MRPDNDTDAGGLLARWRRMGWALRYRNFRLFFLGHGLSQTGTWVQRVAQAWLVYRLTGSEFLLGVVGFSGHILTFFCAPFAGVVADRIDRRRLLVAIQFVAMAQAFALAALTLTGVVTVWHIIVLSLLLGLVSAFDIPTRHSFVVELVDKREDLPNAIALNSLLLQGAKLVGPAVAGAVVYLIGEGMCFLLNGFSYVAVLGSLLAIRLRRREAEQRALDVLRRLSEGFAHAFGFGPIRAVLIQLSLMSVLGISYSTLMPVFAKDVLGGGPGTLGLLMAAPGVGALAGTLYLASRSGVAGLSRVMAGASALFALSLVAFATSRHIVLSLALLTAAGCGMIVMLVSSNTLIQTIVDDDKRGRVLSFYAMSLLGMRPFGSLLVGALASRLGAPWAVAIGGAGCLAATAVFFSRLRLLEAAIAGRQTDNGFASHAASSVQVEEAPIIQV